MSFGEREDKPFWVILPISLPIVDLTMIFARRSLGSDVGHLLPAAAVATLGLYSRDSIRLAVALVMDLGIFPRIRIFAFSSHVNIPI